MSTFNSGKRDPSSQKRVEKLADVKKEHVSKPAVKHRRPRPICKVCGRSFSKPANLKAHERIHTGEKRYSCLVCHRRFVWKSSLNFHSRTAHRDITVGTENVQQTILAQQALDESNMVLQESLCPRFLVDQQVPAMSTTNEMNIELPDLKVGSDTVSGHADSPAMDTITTEEPFNLLGSWEEDHSSLLGIWGDPVTYGYQDVHTYFPSAVGVDTDVSTPPFSDTSTPESGNEKAFSL